MKFFSSQNFQRNNGKTVYLNFLDMFGNFNFCTIDHDDDDAPVEETPKEFRRAKVRKIMYNYKGGLHECNYSETKTVNGTTVKFTYELNKTTITWLDVDYLVYDYAAAAFQNGNPIYKIEVFIDTSTGALTGRNLITRVQYSPSAYYMIDCESESDDTSAPPTLHIPVFAEPGNGEQAPSFNVSNLLQGWMGDYPFYSRLIRRNVDDIGGPTMVNICAWFPVATADYIILVAVHNLLDNFLTGHHPLRTTQYTWFSDEPSMAYEGQTTNLDYSTSTHYVA